MQSAVCLQFGATYIMQWFMIAGLANHEAIPILGCKLFAIIRSWKSLNFYFRKLKVAILYCHAFWYFWKMDILVFWFFTEQYCTQLYVLTIYILDSKQTELKSGFKSAELWTFRTLGQITWTELELLRPNTETNNVSIYVIVYSKARRTELRMRAKPVPESYYTYSEARRMRAKQASV